MDHAIQWRDILLGTSSLSPRNGNFEDNRTSSITGLPDLADGAVHLASITGDNDSPMVLDWRILAANGEDAADGDNGFHNPTAGTYAGAVDSANDGVLPNMNGKHVALLDGGTAGNYFLQNTRKPAQANTIYTLTVAVGVRDNPASIGGARLEITAAGAVVAFASFDKPALDALCGSDASGAFTDASVSWTTGTTPPANQLLEIRIVKEGGTGTVLDFDNVRFTATAHTFSNYMSGFNVGGLDGFNDDPDGDDLPNGLEAWFGTDPGVSNMGLSVPVSDGTTTTFSHPQNATPPGDLTGVYQWSSNLLEWYDGDGADGPSGGPTVLINPNPGGATTNVSATSSEPMKGLFLRLRVMQN